MSLAKCSHPYCTICRPSSAAGAANELSPDQFDILSRLVTPTRTPLLATAGGAIKDQSKITSDGSSTDYYQIPEGAVDLLDLIEHKKMSFGLGNIFKAVYRLGEKSGTDEAYDLRKIIFFAQRRLKRLEEPK